MLPTAMALEVEAQHQRHVDVAERGPHGVLGGDDVGQDSGSGPSSRIEPASTNGHPG